ncbi:MAG: DUF2191 domain-containing protein [Nitrospirae bacterium]|nr:MAG: DUF2191 domain-containing protein [Nitrospirota bacterium]
MRTTLTLDDDIALRLKARCREEGRPFKEVVNETLRAGLEAERFFRPQAPFRVEARELGLRAGHSLDNVAELLEQLEGAAHR